MAPATAVTWYYVIYIVLSKARCDPEAAGELFESDSALDQDAQGIFLMDDVVFPKSVVFNVSVYGVRPDRSVFVQIWRPIDKQSLTYTLIGQTKITTGTVPMYYEKILRARDEMIFTEAGDRLAICHKTQSSPVAYRFSQIMIPVYRSAPGSNITVSIGSEVTFMDVKFPYRFSVVATFDTDIDHYLQSGTLSLIAPTVTQSTIETVPPVPPNRGSLVYVGNTLATRDGVMTSNARGVYILRHVRFNRGVVVSFFAYFVRKAPVSFQVWRLLSSDGVTRFMLVGQIRAEPKLFPWRQEIKLKDNEFIFTQENDVLGILVEGEINPVGFNWIYEDSDRKPLGSRPEADGAGMLYPGRIITFSTVELPYDFAVGALYDTDPSTEKYGTPRPVTMATTSTWLAEVTTLTTTIMDIVQAPSIGKDTIKPTRRSLKTHTRQIFLLWDARFPTDAVVTSFYAYFVNAGIIEFQVWRQVNATRFQLIGRTKYKADSPGYQQVTLSSSEQIQVKSGDCLGYYNYDDKLGAVGYHFEASSLYYNSLNFSFSQSEMLTFQEMLYPYRFAIAASYQPIVHTTISSDEVARETSPSKLKCPPYCDRPEQLAQPVTGRYSWLFRSEVLLGFLVWLIVLTLLFVVICALYVQQRKRSKTIIYRPRPYSFTNPVTSSFGRYDATTKGQDDGAFFNVTLGRGGNCNGARHVKPLPTEKSIDKRHAYTRM